VRLRLLAALLNLGLVLVLLPFLATTPAWAEGFEIFKPIAARATPTDWKTQFGCSDGLHRALQAYEKAPDMKGALEILSFYGEFQANAPMREALLKADKHLFTTVDAAKYELVMMVRKRMPGVVRSRRFGSTGKRDLALIKWANAEHPLDERMPDLDAQKQFNTDDDITLEVDPLIAAADPLANEKVNGSRAAEEFKAVSRELGRELDPKIVEVEFLSPTKIWDVLVRKGARPAWPNYFYQWTASNPEKYNDMFAVEQLEVWGYEKGTITTDVHNPRAATHPISEVTPAPPPPPPAKGIFGYMANNYRQVYANHDGDFFYQCKYLARMIDAWEVINGEENIPPEWKLARQKALAVYQSGDRSLTAQIFKFQVGSMIDQVVETAHEYHLNRVGDSLLTAMRNANLRPDQPLSLDVLGAANPDLLTELDALIVAYSNVPDRVHQKLMAQFARAIESSDAGDAAAEILKSKAFQHVMEIVQAESGFSRQQIVGFREIKATVKQNLEGLIKETSLDDFVEKVARGQASGEELMLVDGRIRRVKRQLQPDEVARDVRFLRATSIFFGWDQRVYAERMQEFMDAGPPQALNILRRIYDVFDATRARPYHIEYTDDDGESKRFTVEASGRNLGVHAFKAALKGYDLWGKAKNGRELFVQLESIYSGGLTDEEVGQATAHAFAAALDIYDLLKTDVFQTSYIDIKATGILSELAKGTAGAAAAGDVEAQEMLMTVAFKDLILLWQPQLAPVFVLYEVANWAYSEYSLRGAKADVLDAMLQNGVWQIRVAGAWKPLDKDSFKEGRTGDPKALRLEGVRKQKGGATLPKIMLTRETFEVELAESGRKVLTRPSMMELAYRQNYIARSPILAVSIDAIKRLSQSRWYRGGVRSQDSKNWTWDAMADFGVIIQRREDQTSPVPRDVAVLAPGVEPEGNEPWIITGLTRNQMRLMGYLMADFWLKRQLVLQNDVLKDTEKEVARRMLDKMKTAAIRAGQVDFMAQVREIDDEVRRIDHKLWPRIAASSRPFDGPDVYDKAQTPILDGFVATTRETRERLKRYEDFLQGPEANLTETIIPEEDDEMLAIPYQITIDRAAAERRTIQILENLRKAQFELYDGYEKIHGVLDNGQKRVAEGGVSLPQLHAGLTPGSWSLTAMIKEGFSPAAADIEAANSWYKGYLAQRIRIAEDIEKLAKEHPVPDGLLDRLDSLLQYPDVRGSPSHPLWPELTRLRYQIEKLTLMGRAAGRIDPAELERHVGPMTIEADQKVEVPDLADAEQRAGFPRELVAKMEIEYQRLLGRLSHLFDIALTMSPDPNQTEPFIGQPIEVTAQLVDPNLPTTRLGPHGFPDYVKRFEWTVLNEKGRTVVGPELTDTRAQWSTYFPDPDLHLVKVKALDGGGNIVASESIGALARPVRLVGSVSAEGAYNGEPIRIFSSSIARGEITRLGDFTLEIAHYEPDEWKEPREALAVLAIEAEGSEDRITTNVSNIDPAFSKGVVKVVDDLKFELPDFSGEEPIDPTEVAESGRTISLEDVIEAIQRSTAVALSAAQASRKACDRGRAGMERARAAVEALAARSAGLGPISPSPVAPTDPEGAASRSTDWAAEIAEIRDQVQAGKNGLCSLPESAFNLDAVLVRMARMRARAHGLLDSMRAEADRLNGWLQQVDQGEARSGGAARQAADLLGEIPGVGADLRAAETALGEALASDPRVEAALVEARSAYATGNERLGTAAGTLAEELVSQLRARLDNAFGSAVAVESLFQACPTEMIDEIDGLARKLEALRSDLELLASAAPEPAPEASLAAVARAAGEIDGTVSISEAFVDSIDTRTEAAAVCAASRQPEPSTTAEANGDPPAKGPGGWEAGGVEEDSGGSWGGGGFDAPCRTAPHRRAAIEQALGRLRAALQATDRYGEVVESAQQVAELAAAEDVCDDDRSRVREILERVKAAGDIQTEQARAKREQRALDWSATLGLIQQLQHQWDETQARSGDGITRDSAGSYRVPEHIDLTKLKPASEVPAMLKGFDCATLNNSGYRCAEQEAGGGSGCYILGVYVGGGCEDESGAGENPR
jgi:hypothetical protein